MNLVTEIKKTQLTKDDILIIKLRENISPQYQDKVYAMLMKLKENGELKCPFILTQENVMSFEAMGTKRFNQLFKKQIFELMDEWFKQRRQK